MSSGSDVAALQRLVARLRERIAFVEGSKFWRARSLWFRARARLGGGPPIEPPPIPPPGFSEVMDAGALYTRWLHENEPRAADLARMRECSLRFTDAPSIGVVVDDAGGDLGGAVASVLAQVYPATVLARTSRSGSNARDGAVARLNAALAACPADVVTVCPEGYELAPHATFEIALAFAEHPDAIAAYGDRDVIEPDGSRGDPVFAPDWSPETFLSTTYTGPAIFYRRQTVLAAGGLREGFGRAALYDLALRALEGPGRVVHRPAIIVHERRLRRAERRDGRARDEARALADAFERRGEPGRVLPSSAHDARTVRFARPRDARVDVLIPTRDLSAKLERCLRSVYERNPGASFRVTVIDNGSVEAATAALLERYAALEPSRFRVLRRDEPFNFSRLTNAGARSCDAPYLLLLNNDAAFICDDAIAAMVEYAARPSIGAVGARLQYADASLQHAGVVIGIGGLAGHVYRGTSAEAAARHPAIAGIRDYSAVTAACLMVRRDAFEAVGGFDEGLAVEFNDIDFCLKLARAGLRNVYLGHVVLRHDESSTRGETKTTSPAVLRERERFRSRWRSDTYRDPYYNPNLTRAYEDASIVR